MINFLTPFCHEDVVEMLKICENVGNLGNIEIPANYVGGPLGAQGETCLPGPLWEATVCGFNSVTSDIWVSDICESESECIRYLGI